MVDFGKSAPDIIQGQLGWLKPAPGQTQKMDAALQMQKQREHQKQQQQELDQLHNISKDVAANLTQQAYQDARIQQQGNLQYEKPSLQFPLKTEGESFIDNAKKLFTNPLAVGGNPIVQAGNLAAGAAGKDTTAPSLRDPWTKAAYLPEQHQYANTEIALGRALAAHPELINKPYLLMTAALSDMQAHDIKHLATMDDMMKIYSTAIMSDDGLKNASEAMYNRIMANPGASMAQTIGSGVQKAVEFAGNLQTDLEALLASASGRTVTQKVTKPGEQQAPLNISGGEGAPSAIFGGAQTVGNVLGGIWRNTGEHLFGIQHAIRTESNIRRTQGDAQADLYLGTWFSTAVMMNFAGKGFALALKGLEKTALKSTLERAGISGTEAATLEQLHILAQGAKIGDKRWIRLIQASQDWLMHASTDTGVRNKLFAAYARKGMDEPMLGRYARKVKDLAEDASGVERAGAFIGRNLSPTGKVLKDVATYGARHAHIPLNLELAAQLVSNTNGFGLGHEWDKSWEVTTDGAKYKDPITHAPISFGREVASAVGAEPNTWWYNMVSGPLDFLSWFEFDPFQAILTPISETKQLENKGMLKRVYGGIGIRSATDVYNLNARSPKFRAFIDKVVDLNKEAIPHRLETAEQFRKSRQDKIARKTAEWKKKGLTQAQIDVRLAASRLTPLTDAEASQAALSANPKASSIARLYKNFPELSHAVRPSELEAGENFMKLLSQVESKEEAVELFASIAKAHQYLNTYRAPSYSRFMSAKDWARVQVENRIENKTDKLIAEGRYADAAKAGLDNKFYRMFTSMKPVYWDEMHKFSNQVVKIGDPKSLDLMGRMLRASGVDPLTADLLINRLAMSNSSLEWKTIYWNWARDTFNLYVESQLQELVIKSGLNAKEANKVRNLLSTSFGHAMEELGNPFGGGGARNVYSGANVNGIVDAKRPFPSAGAMTDTAGLGAMHEHYLPLFDYKALDNIVRDVSKYLKSTDGRKEIVKAVEDVLAKPLNDKLADVQKQMKAIEDNYAKSSSATVPMRDFSSIPEPVLSGNEEKIINKADEFAASGGSVRTYTFDDYDEDLVSKIQNYKKDITQQFDDEASRLAKTLNNPEHAKEIATALEEHRKDISIIEGKGDLLSSVLENQNIPLKKFPEQKNWDATLKKFYELLDHKKLFDEVENTLVMDLDSRITLATNKNDKITGFYTTEMGGEHGATRVLNFYALDDSSFASLVEEMAKNNLNVIQSGKEFAVHSVEKQNDFFADYTDLFNFQPRGSKYRFRFENHHLGQIATRGTSNEKMAFNFAENQRLRTLSKEDYVKEIHSETERLFFSETPVEKITGKPVAPAQRFRDRSYDDGEQLANGELVSRRERYETYIEDHDFYVASQALERYGSQFSKDDLLMTLTDLESYEISGAWEDAVDTGVGYIQRLSSSAMKPRYKDQTPLEDVILSQFAQNLRISVGDLRDVLSGGYKEFKEEITYLADNASDYMTWTHEFASLEQYTISSQRFRSWLRSQVLNPDYSGIRHQLGKINPEEEQYFKDMAWHIDNAMEPLQTETRLVRTLNPDPIAKTGESYKAGAIDTPDHFDLKNIDEYVIPLPFTFDKDTGAIRQMSVDEVRVGAVLHDPGYQSTSFGKTYFAKEPYNDWAYAVSVEDATMASDKIVSTMFHYTAPPGTHGFMMGDISNHSEAEREFLLARGLTSVITHVEVVKASEFSDEGVMMIYAAILPQGAQEAPLTVYMRNRDRIEEMAFNKLMDGTHNWADVLKDVEAAAARREKIIATIERTPEQRKLRASGAEKGVVDRLRMDIQRRGETEGLNYQTVDVINDFLNMVGKDMFEGVRLNTISRSKAGLQSDTLANYDFGSKMVNLFSRAVINEGVDRAFLHEAWHHLSSFIHPEEVEKFSSQMMKARTRFMRANNFKGYLGTIDEDAIKNLEAMKKSGSKEAAKELQGINYMKQLVAKGWHKNSDKVIWDALPGAYRGGLENYRLESVDEWFAETMYDRTRNRMATTNPLVEWMYNVIGQVVRGINKISGAGTSRRVFDDFIKHRYSTEQADKMPMAQRIVGANPLVSKARMASAPHTADPAWKGLSEQAEQLRKDKKDLLSAATGDYRFYELPERMQMTASNGAHNLHTIVRQRLIDDYFRKMSLATGSFSMRVSASEAIPNAFRVGVGTYTKNALFSHVERAARQYEKDYKRVVTRDEMGYVQKRVYDILRDMKDEDLKFYGKNFPSEVKRYVRRLERDFTKGLVSGKSYEKFVGRMTKDILINGYTVGGLSADHADVYSGGRDAIGAQFRNLANGHGSGNWAPNGEMNTDTLAALGKVWQDITHDPLQRTTAKILDDYLNPVNFRGASYQERLDTATEKIHKVTKQMVRKNPGIFDNMDRAAEGKMLEATRDRIAAELLAENGLPAGTPINGRLLDELKDRLQKVDSLEEWANANIQHILWATHGRGSTGGFSFPDMGDRVFHRRILSMLGKGEAPDKVNEVEKLIITPDAEHARVLQHIKGSVARKSGGERTRYHDALYGPSSNFHDQATFDSLTEGAETIPQLIKKHKPMATTPLQRASSRRAIVKGTGLRDRYGDTSGKVHSLFPDNIPTQMGNGYDAPNFIDRFSDRVHDVVSRRVIDSVARRPLYAVELNAQLDFLEPLVKSGALTEDLAFSIAQSRAINQGIKYVHNPQDRMLFEQWSRAYAPFWFAQNQALRRMGRLALQNPAAFEKYMLLQLMFMQSGATSASNIDSQNAALIPGSMFGGRLFTSALKHLGLSPTGNVPIGLTGSLTSLNSVFPWNDPSGLHTGSPTALLEHLRPQFGPLVAAPLKALEALKPYGMTLPFIHSHISTKKLNESVLGDVGANSGMMHAVIPNPALRALAGTAISVVSGGRVTDSELTSPITSIQYGLIPQYYEQKSNEIIKKAQAQAKKDWDSQYGAEVAARQPKDYQNFLHDETFSYMLNGYEDPGNPNLGFKGLAEYWSDPAARHNLAQDTSLAAQIIYLGRTAISFFSPVSTQATQVQPELQKFIHDLYGTKGETQKIIDLIKKHPEAISFLEARQSASALGIPLDASVNMAIYQEQNKDLFTDSRLTAGVAMLLPYHKKGSERDSHEYNLQKNMGLRSKYTPDPYIQNMARSAGNFYAFEYLPQMTETLYGGDDTRQRELAREHAKQNTAWTSSLGEGKLHRQAAFMSLERVLRTKGINNRPGLKETAPLARQLVSDYRDYQSQLAQAMPGNYSVIQGDWQQHVEAFRKKNPVASVLIDSLFKNLSLRDVR